MPLAYCIIDICKSTNEITSIPATIGVLYSNIINIISFRGFTGVIISYTLPGLIYLKAIDNPLLKKHNNIMLWWNKLNRIYWCNFKCNIFQ